MVTFARLAFGLLIVLALAATLFLVRRPTRRLVALILIGVVLILALVPPMQALNRLTWYMQFRTFATTSSPPGVELCGRYFKRTSRAMTRAEAEAQSQGPLSVVAHTPAGTPIVAYFSNPVAFSDLCTFHVYVAAILGRLRGLSRRR